MNKVSTQILCSLLVLTAIDISCGKGKKGGRHRKHHHPAGPIRKTYKGQHGKENRSGATNAKTSKLNKEIHALRVLDSTLYIISKNGTVKQIRYNPNDMKSIKRRDALTKKPGYLGTTTSIRAAQCLLRDKGIKN